MAREPAPRPRHEAAASAFRTVIDRLRAGDPGAATLLPELERFAAYAPGWLALGALLQDRSNHEAAVVAFSRAANASPPSAVAWHRLGQCLARTGRHDAAIGAFEHAVRIDPVLAEGWYSLASAHHDRGAHRQAAGAYRAALRARPDLHEAAFNLGVVLQETGDMEQAMDAYGAALRLRPQSLARIAQALACGPTGTLWLDPEAMRRALSARRGNPCDNGPDS